MQMKYVKTSVTRYMELDLINFNGQMTRGKDCIVAHILILNYAILLKKFKALMRKWA